MSAPARLRAELEGFGARLRAGLAETLAGPWARLEPRVDAARTAWRAWAAEPGNLRRAGWLVLAALLVAGLLLPPVSLGTRIRTLGYTQLRPGEAALVASNVPGAQLELSRRAVLRPARMRLRSTERIPSAAAELPAGRVAIGPVFAPSLAGPAPREAWLATSLDIGEGEQAFVDPYGWDGERWRWLDMQFQGANRLRVRLPLEDWVPELVVVTRALESPSALSTVLLPPPAAVPAAVAELPILEIRAYTIRDDDGRVEGYRFPVPSRKARVYGVVDNLEGQRVRSDLIDNLLLQPESRLRHRQTLAQIAQRDGLAGLVLDYRGISADLQGVYGDWLGRLREDLHAVGAELIVTVPMPRQTATGWNGDPFNWRRLGQAADGLRVLLPDDRPPETEALDGMVRWALQQVARDKLQLAMPVQGRDLVENTVTPISYGAALAKVLDLAEGDAPERLSPGAEAAVELPTIRAAELGRDPATGMWRFHYWDANRRQHTVWMNDAAGLHPVFEISRRYFLSRLVLDGVEAGLDPGLWQMAQAFVEAEGAAPPPTEYRLQWQLTDEDGKVVQEAIQPVATPVFAFRAPSAEGLYRLGVNLLTAGDRLAAIGESSELRVAPPPPQAPAPTANVIIIQPTPIPVVTAPVPLDEQRIDRAPVAVAERTAAAAEADADAVVQFVDAQLRDAPDVLRGRVITDLRVGDRLDVTARSADGQWLRVVNLATGVEGWTLARLVELAVAVEAVPVVEEEEAGG